MPKKRGSPSLQDLAMHAVGCWVKDMGEQIISLVFIAHLHNAEQSLHLLQQALTWLNESLYASVPWYFYNSMADVILLSIKDLIQETKESYDDFVPATSFLTRMKVAVDLTEVVIHPKLRYINISRWPKIMRHALNKNLYKLIGLEHLNLGSGSGGWEGAEEVEKYILSGIQHMYSLTSLCLCFDCTNNIIIMVGNNCPHLKFLDITSSRSVTNKCIPALMNCKYLKEVRLYRTSVTVEGYKDLLANVPGIINIGRCDEFGSVLEKFHEENFQVLGLKSIQCRDMTISHLKLLVIYCPYLLHLSIFHDENVADLTVLSALVNLKELKILNCDFFTDKVKNLLENCGANLTSLHLEHVEEIDLNALTYISQFCPKLKSLILYNCEFLHHTSISLTTLKYKPFECLERLLCVADCALNHLEFLLTHCKNIRYIQLGSSTGICDRIMLKVLQANPMTHLEELKILYSCDLSMHTVKLLMAQCDKLRIMSELESWEGISTQELNEFKEYIKKNNYDLDIRPTLSYS